MADQSTKPTISRARIRLTTFAILFGFAIIFSVYDVLVAYPDAPHTGTGDNVAFTVEKGITPRQLTDRLAAAGVIASPGKFGLWLKLSGKFPGVKAGDFTLTGQMTPREILTALQGRGVGKGIRVTIPEGFTLSDIARALANAELVSPEAFRAACFNPSLLRQLGIPGPSAEGFLFPDTYYFEATVTPKAIIEKMHENFHRKTASLSLPDGHQQLNIVTLASIVQSEARIAEEAPIIAGVYTNRLNAAIFPGQRLQADPTVAYGCNSFLPEAPPSCATFKGVLGSRQLQDELNPYNTYRHSGLPPGPICAPGMSALKAARSPAKVPYLYFVVSTDGRHKFSTTLAEHNAAVEEYRKSLGQ
jgi:UPF0755 protein